ncbi:hypothetical protein QEV83_07850 [Methylocapsa sp. D3K7]|uniref:hypothetical protein n=1 Tax=Methylocapsa sp. D3K7 TaxID=3041435 RepID=UPI00244ED3B1|nr:hypothetical protein [Methylocapsa sp. D3K7]WGJ16145.1 hypothetical protein QEV83_07850 [Methylocapsa sp. D3K7]
MDVLEVESPAALAGAPGSDLGTLICSTDTQTTIEKFETAQAKIDQLFDDIGPNINAMGAMLNAAAAMHEAGDPAGLIYALRRVRAYWVAVSESAKELVAADAERLSALRKESRQ